MRLRASLLVLTLLSHGDFTGAERRLKAAWRKFRVYLQRQLQKPPEFVWVLARSDGKTSLHVLLRAAVPKYWVAAAWRRVGGTVVERHETVGIRNGIDWLAGRLEETSVKPREIDWEAGRLAGTHVKPRRIGASAQKRGASIGLARRGARLGIWVAVRSHPRRLFIWRQVSPLRIPPPED